MNFLPLTRRHGGELNIGKRKKERPIATKRAMHLTLRSSMAKGKFNFLNKQNRAIIETLISQLSKKWGVKVYKWSNNGNHLHLVVMARTREGFKSFLRALSGRIAQRVTGSKKGKSLKTSFWDYIPWTEVIEWGRHFNRVMAYVEQNYLEGLGIIPYQPRHQRSLSRAPS